MFENTQNSTYLVDMQVYTFAKNNTSKISQQMAKQMPIEISQIWAMKFADLLHASCKISV